MNVMIRGRSVVYVPDYTPTNSAWKIQLRDAHRLAFVGGTECFVKRFARRLPAWDFLVANRGQRHAGLPLIHDAQSVTENGQTVYYLFLEKIDGQLLHDLVRKGGRASGPALGKSMTAAFRVLHAQGYWHADFCTKNIMATTADEQFMLIDLDSLEPVTTPPSPTPNEPGYLPDQELAVYALTYVKTYVQPTIKTFAALPGSALNLVQLIFLLDKLVYFAVSLKPQGAKFGQKKHFEKLPALVQSHLAPYTDRLVKDILANRPVADELILSQGSNFQAQLQAGSKLAPTAPSLARIVHLRASKATLKPGESTVISWETVGASFASLTYYTAVATSGALTLTYEQLANYSGKKEGRIKLTLSLGQQGQAQTVSVELKPDSVVNYPSVRPAIPSVATAVRPVPVVPQPLTPVALTTAPPALAYSRKTDYRSTAKVLRFIADRKYLAQGEFASLSWKAENCDEVWISCDDMGKEHWASPWNKGWGQGGKKFQSAESSTQVSLTDFGPAPEKRLWLVFELFKTDNENTKYGNIMFLDHKDFTVATVNLIIVPHKRHFLTFWFWVLIANIKVAHRLKSYYQSYPSRQHPIAFWRNMKKFSGATGNAFDWWFGDWVKNPVNDAGFSRFGCFFIYFPLLLFILFGLVTTCARG